MPVVPLVLLTTSSAPSGDKEKDCKVRAMPMQGGVETIAPYVDTFIAFAQAHPELHFLVAPIGCGIAGFSEQEIAPLFRAPCIYPAFHSRKAFTV